MGKISGMLKEKRQSWGLFQEEEFDLQRTRQESVLPDAGDIVGQETLDGRVMRSEKWS